MAVTRRHLTGYLKGIPGAATLRQRLVVTETMAACVELLEESRQRRAAARSHDMEASL